MRILDLFCGAGGAAMGYELAWAAGFFDGEGSISVRHDRRPGRHPGLLIDIEQVDVRPLLRFRDAVGWKGNIVLRPARGRSRPIHRIAMAHTVSVATLDQLWPYLSEPKREQALAAIGRLDVAS